MHILFAVYIGVVRLRLPAELVAILPALWHGNRGRRHNQWVSFDKHHPVNVTPSWQPLGLFRQSLVAGGSMQAYQDSLSR